MSEQPQWGREGRRARREQSRALAREILSSLSIEPQGKIQTKDWILFCLAGVLAVAIFLAEKNPRTVIGYLVLMFALLIHPALNMPWVTSAAPIRRKYIKGAVSLLAIGIIVSAFGISQWPKPTSRHLRGREKEQFQRLVQPYPQKVMVEALVSDDEANEFAEDLILALFEAKWDVKSLHPQGIIVDRPAKGLLIYYKQMGDTTHEHLENALKKLGFPDVQSFWDMQEPTDIVVVVGTCTSCRSN